MKNSLDPVLVWKLVPAIFEDHHIAWWGLIGGIYFGLVEAVLFVLGEPLYLWLVLFAAYMLSVGPLASIATYRNLGHLGESFQELYDGDEAEFNEWFQSTRGLIFNKNSSLMWGVALIVYLSSNIVVTAFPAPFESHLANAFVLLAFQPVFFQGGLAILHIIGIFWIQYKLVRIPITVNFLDDHRYLTNQFTQTSVQLAFIILGSYALFFWAVRTGPYDSPILTTVPLGVIAFFPLTAVFWSLIQVRHLKNRIREHDHEAISRIGFKVFEDLEESRDPEHAETVRHLIEIRAQIDEVYGWSLETSTWVSIILGLITTIIEVILLMKRFGLF